MVSYRELAQGPRTWMPVLWPQGYWWPWVVPEGTGPEAWRCIAKRMGPSSQDPDLGPGFPRRPPATVYPQEDDSRGPVFGRSILVESSKNGALLGNTAAAQDLGPTHLRCFKHLRPAKVHTTHGSRAEWVNPEPRPALHTRGCRAGSGAQSVTLQHPSPPADSAPVCPSSLPLTSDLQTADAHRQLPQP